MPVHLSAPSGSLAIHILGVAKQAQSRHNLGNPGKNSGPHDSARRQLAVVRERQHMDVHLLVVQGQPRGKSLHFSPGEFVFGCGPECDIRPNSAWVSRQHCMLRVTNNSVSVRDLGSSNGTLVNGTRVIGERQLAVGDQIQVGPVVLEMQMRIT
jgi:hypothetical protein